MGITTSVISVVGAISSLALATGSDAVVGL
jgi:hypothetical protein